jgi:hypothetical protein
VYEDAPLVGPFYEGGKFFKIMAINWPGIAHMENLLRGMRGRNE